MNIDTSLTAKNLGAARSQILGIILHDTAGSGTHNDTKYLANPGDGRGVSVDFTVERDGSVYQLNPDLKAHSTFHAGRATRFRGYKNGQVNRVCIGIEIVQKADLSLKPLYPDEQVVAVAELCRFLCDEYDLTREDITTHKAVITDGSRSDPRQFPWAQFEEVFAAGGTVTEDVHIVSAGETLWGLSQKYGVKIEDLKRWNGMNTASNLLTIGQRLVVRS